MAVLLAAMVLWASQGGLRAWDSQGPSSITGGQTTNIPGNNPVIGAIQSLLVNPIAEAGGAITAYAGSVNGGVWRTTDLLATNAVWAPLTDNMPSLSVGTMAFDQADITYQTLVYGAGAYSNYYGVSGPLTGVFRSGNSGLNWTQLGASTFAGASISSLAINGSNYAVGVVSQNGTASGGIFLSADSGGNFTQVQEVQGLPNAPVAALTADPNNAGRLVAGVVGNGIYVSTNGGGNWTQTTPLPNVTPVGGNATINPNTNNDSFKIVAQKYGSSTVLYVGVDTAKSASGFFRSTDFGLTWDTMLVPTTVESGVVTGLMPGGQGLTNFSLAADPTNSNMIYVGGDRQPAPNPSDPNSGPSSATPTSSGAINWTARLFSGSFNATSNATTWTPITDNYARTNQASPSGVDGTSPHADSRAFAFTPSGSLLAADDGGISLRSNPAASTGLWTSLNGNLAVTETTRVAYDSNTNTVITGTQDVGATMQAAPGSGNYTTSLQGDGGDVAVDAVTLASEGKSIRYTQCYNYSYLNRSTYSSSNVQIGSKEDLALKVTGVLGGGTAANDKLTKYESLFYPRIQLNSVTPSSIAFGGSYYLFTSPDKGENLTQLNAAKYESQIVDLAYGGKHGDASNANVIWAANKKQIIYGNSTDTAAPGVLTTIGSLPVISPLITNESFVALAVNPKEYYDLAIASAMHVWLTTNASSFSDITGNLFALGLQEIVTIAYLSGGAGGDALLVGGSGGAFASLLSNRGTWFSIAALSGAALPNAYINELLYSKSNDTIYAATIGRGVYSLSNASALIVPEPAPWQMLLPAIALACFWGRRRAGKASSAGRSA